MDTNAIEVVEPILDEIVLNKSDLLRAAIRHLDREGIISLDEMMSYRFEWCLLEEGFGLKITRSQENA